MLEAGKVDALDEATKLAPTLADPPPDGPADRRARRNLVILVGFTSMWCLILFSGLLSARGDLVGVLVFGGMGCFGLYLLVPAIQRFRAALRAPFVREPVVVIERRREGGASRNFVATVVNRDDQRRDLVVFADPGQVQVGDVGVAFSRDKMLWHFHRIN